MELKRGNYRMFSDENGEYKQEPLGYSFGALEPHIDAQTMEIHYSKHHAGYVRKLNKALTAYKGQKVNSLEMAFQNITTFPNAIRNNGGGHYNHTLFWKVMKPGGNKFGEGEFASAVAEDLGGFAKMKEQFTQAAARGLVPVGHG